MNHSFDCEIAKKVGMHAAAVYQSLLYWSNHVQAEGLNEADGRNWVYNTYKGLAKSHEYLSPSQVRRAVDKLVEVGMVLKRPGEGNIGNCYAIAGEKSECVSRTDAETRRVENSKCNIQDSKKLRALSELRGESKMQNNLSQSVLICGEKVQDSGSDEFDRPCKKTSQRSAEFDRGSAEFDRGSDEFDRRLYKEDIHEYSTNVLRERDKGVKPQAGNEKAGSLSLFSIPTIEEIREYFKARGFTAKAEVFYNYQAAHRGFENIRDWRALANVWESRENGEARGERQEVPEGEKVCKVCGTAEEVRQVGQKWICRDCIERYRTMSIKSIKAGKGAYPAMSELGDEQIERFSSMLEDQYVEQVMRGPVAEMRGKLQGGRYAAS